MSLRILIADDEPLARARLRALIEELGHEVCAEVGDGRSAEQELLRKRPDVLLLDVEMPEIDGLTLAQRTEADYPHIPVVLVTAHAQHALAAFDASVCDYVLKPVRRERLTRALDRAMEQQKSGDASVYPALRLSIGRREHLARLDEIDCFVADAGYVLARSARLEGFVDTPLQDIEQRYGAALLRVHRSCLAVKGAIAGLETRSSTDHRLLFRDGLESVPISRRQLAEVRDFLRTR